MRSRLSASWFKEPAGLHPASKQPCLRGAVIISQDISELIDRALHAVDGTADVIFVEMIP